MYNTHASQKQQFCLYIFKRCQIVKRKKYKHEINKPHGIYMIQNKNKQIDLTYLIDITNSNSIMIEKMISIFLKETPPLIQSLKKSFKKNDWDALHADTHNLLPIFHIMGMNEGFEKMTYKIHQYFGEIERSEEIQATVSKLEQDCELAYIELKEELIKIRY